MEARSQPSRKPPRGIVAALTEPTKMLFSSALLLSITLLAACKQESVASEQGPKPYELMQLHFHTPSEHQIDGVTYPVEMHVVNMMDPKSETEPPSYLVMSFLYKMGDADPFITSFLDQVPDAEGGKDVKPGQVDLAARDRNPDHDYYHYRGSPTTPPYTETVEWLIAKGVQEASPEQIRRINLLEGNNARRVQALYGRKIDD